MNFDSQKRRTYIIPIIILILVVLIFQFLFDTGLSISKHKRLHKLTQFYFHGIVQNATHLPLRITESKYPRIIPPGESSLDIGVNDADSLIIDSPTEIDGHIYTSGVFKFCDFGILTVTETPTINRVVFARRFILCKPFNDFHHYRNIKEAFEDRKL